MFKSDAPITNERLEEMRKECESIYVKALSDLNKLDSKFPLIALCFNSDTGFLNVTNKNDYELYTEKIKNLLDAIQPILKHLDIR